MTEILFEGVGEIWGDGEYYFGVGGPNLVNGAAYNVKINGVTYSGFIADFYEGDGWYISNGEFTVNIETPVNFQDGSVYIYDSAGFFGGAETLTMEIIQGEENIARKIKKAYIGVNGVAQLFFEAP